MSVVPPMTMVDNEDGFRASVDNLHSALDDGHGLLLSRECRLMLGK